MFSALRVFGGWTRLPEVPPGVRGVELFCDFSGGSFWDMLCGKGPENLAVVEVSAAQPYHVGIAGLSGKVICSRRFFEDARFCLVPRRPCSVFVLTVDEHEAHVRNVQYKSERKRSFFDGPLLR